MPFERPKDRKQRNSAEYGALGAILSGGLVTGIRRFSDNLAG